MGHLQHRILLSDKKGTDTHNYLDRSQRYVERKWSAWQRLYGRAIAAENRTAVARDREYEEVVTVKHHEGGSFWGNETAVYPSCGVGYLNLYMC